LINVLRVRYRFPTFIHARDPFFYAIIRRDTILLRDSELEAARTGRSRMRAPRFP